MRASQQVMLVVLRTLIGWHFLYEGYFKLVRPAWGPDGVPLTAWTSSGYLRDASGPLAGVFSAIGSSSWIGGIDQAVTWALVAVGVSLILGLFTQMGCLGAMALLAMFYLSAFPTSGLPEPRMEGTYLFVNKNLVELAAVAVIFVFRTGRIAGFDRWFASARPGAARALKEAA